ncbi:hypothetical protein AVO42_11560 [Thiomicrospira sp. XS5]|nr:hypothetical protein AVO42_11560 [Thiomicrospira sp. XS5]
MLRQAQHDTSTCHSERSEESQSGHASPQETLRQAQGDSAILQKMLSMAPLVTLSEAEGSQAGALT